MKIFFIFLYLFSFSSVSFLSGSCPNISDSVSLILVKQDTLLKDQLLYNGRIWRNKYYRIRENEFLFSKDFLYGSLTINEQEFNNLSIRYDIYNDEIMIQTNHGVILQLNKEMVDSFNIVFNNETFRFARIQEDSLKGFKGYVNVLYKGRSSLFVKYKKEIDLLAVDNKFDLFFQTHRIYLMKDNNVFPVSSKGNLLKLLSEDKEQIRNYIKKNKLKVSRTKPQSFVPVIKFYDNISQ